MLKINSVKKSYGKNFSLSIENLNFNDNGVIALLGPNGSGKTTFLKILLGLINPEFSDINYYDSNIYKDFNFKKALSYMPQTAIYPPNLKVKEILEITKSLKPEVKEYDYELYDLFKVNNVLERKFSSLSQGTKQKIAVAIVFMFKNKVIILDEPTAGLDPYASEVLKNKILKEKNSILIIFTTHIISDVIDIAERLIFLFEGKVKFDKLTSDKSVFSDSKNMVNEISNYFKN